MTTPEQRAEYQRTYRAKNKEKISENRRLYELRRREDPNVKIELLARRRAQRMAKESWPIHTLGAVRHRAKKIGVAFNLTVEDILIPDFCPVLGIPLTTGLGPHNPNNPSVDRMIPELGYVKGNVRVISMRANILKRDVVDPEELRKVYEYVLECQRSVH